VDNHVSESELEQYLLHQLPPNRVAVVETHLLLCSYCCDRCEEIETFIQAVRETMSPRRLN
jgi:anti-sigma factor RsiW